MLHSINHDATTDPELTQYYSEIMGHVLDVKALRGELALWAAPHGRAPSELARSLRTQHDVGDSVLRSALRQSIIVSMTMVLDDNQSKCFAQLAPLFTGSPLWTVIDGLYSPLWEHFKDQHKSEIERLKVNRNHLFAHITKGTQPRNEVLQFAPSSTGRNIQESFGMGSRAKFDIIDTEAILVGMQLFSVRSLDYLSALLGALSLATEPQIQQSMEQHLRRHVDDFIQQHPL